MPRIKKASTEVFKDVHTKLGQENFEALLKSSFKNEKQEESKEDDLPYDDVKVQKILKLTSVPVKKPAAAAGKKDFRAFLKQ
jgi:hypothetical protein